MLTKNDLNQIRKVVAEVVTDIAVTKDEAKSFATKDDLKPLATKKDLRPIRKGLKEIIAYFDDANDKLKGRVKRVEDNLQLSSVS